jgi:hypothetical protein
MCARGHGCGHACYAHDWASKSYRQLHVRTLYISRAGSAGNDVARRIEAARTVCGIDDDCSCGSTEQGRSQCQNLTSRGTPLPAVETAATRPNPALGAEVCRCHGVTTLPAVTSVVSNLNRVNNAALALWLITAMLHSHQ